MYTTYHKINNYKKGNPPSLEIDKNAKTTLYKPLDSKTTKIRTYPHKQFITCQLYSQMMLRGPFRCLYILLIQFWLFINIIDRVTGVIAGKSESILMTTHPCEQQLFAQGCQSNEVCAFSQYMLHFFISFQ